MKKYSVMILWVVVFLLWAVQAFAAYDPAAVQAVMPKVMALYGETKQAAQAKDYFTAADKLMEIAKAFKSLEVVTPEKAPKADWDRIHNEVIKSAFRGIGACADGDDAKLQAALDAMAKSMGEGHKMFR